MSERSAMLRSVEHLLGRRQLIWAGIRGSDVEPLRDLPQLAASFTLCDAYSARSDVVGLAYENLTGVRVDPEIWDIDEHHHEPATLEFRRSLMRALSAESALLPYRPSSFLSAIQFARRDRCLPLGMVGAFQQAFEHKPFVESAVATLDIPHVSWTYIADEEQVDVLELAEQGPLILRRSRTSGGEGFVRVDNAEEVADHWPHVDEAFVSVAPYIDNTTPVNVGATVWRNASPDDCVTVHYPSVQLIGISNVVTRQFGYCGNDFGLAKTLESATLEQIERSTKTIGRWLRSHGYLGTFGIDFLVKDGIPLFTEINARFQGSTSTSSRLSIEADQPCLVLEHLASWLGLAMPKPQPLLERIQSSRDLANLAVHWTGPDKSEVDGQSLVKMIATSETCEVGADVVAPRGVLNAPGSLVARLAFGRTVTRTGYELTGELEPLLQRWKDGQTQS